MKSKSKEQTYTPRTCGALPVQLEFDFGPDFIRRQVKNVIETNSVRESLRGIRNTMVSLKTEGDK